MKKQNTMLIFAALLVADLLGAVEVDLFTPAFPQLTHIFQLSPMALQLIMSINFVGYCAGSLICGFLGDRYGSRSIILITLGIFIVGSVFCVWAPNYSMLLFGRLLQGLGMSGPVVLAYVIVTQIYPVEQQPKFIGILMGVSNAGVAIAPVAGSYITAYAGWRGNFVVLLGLSLVTLVICFLSLPKMKPNPSVHLSLRAYIPLLKSKTLLLYMGVVCLAATVYWTFTAFSPLLYMEDLNVDLKNFGYYQGGLAAVFAVVSVVIPFLYRFAHQNVWLKIGMWIAFVFILAAFILSMLVADNPLWITLLMVGHSIGVSFLMNILWPAALDIVPGTKSRASALLMAVRLLVTGVGLEIVGYYYNHTFYPIALSMLICMVGALVLIMCLPAWKHKSVS